MSVLDGPDLCHCHATRRSARALTRLYDAHLAPAQITISQFAILSLLENHPGISVMQLAKVMVMERTTLVRALKPMQREGLVDARAETGSRALRLSLTPDGLRKLDEARPLWQSAQEAFEATLGLEHARLVRAVNLEVALSA